MSTTSRYAWHDQQAALNDRIKRFLQEPGTEQLDAVILELRNYAAAADSGKIEIPQQFTCCH